jgi:hypothetical protein
MRPVAVNIRPVAVNENMRTVAVNIRPVAVNEHIMPSARRRRRSPGPVAPAAADPPASEEPWNSLADPGAPPKPKSSTHTNQQRTNSVNTNHYRIIKTPSKKKNKAKTTKCNHTII